MGCSILDLIDVKALALALRQSQAALGDPLGAFDDSEITFFLALQMGKSWEKPGKSSN
jgi:hypothetical protein